MAKNVGILLAEGFEEVEAVTVIDVLRRADIRVEVLALQNLLVEGAHGIKIKVDEIIFARSSHLYDALVIPGGEPGTTNIEKSMSAQRMILHHFEKKKCLAAICAAPRIFASLKILNNQDVTCYPSVRESITCGNYIEKDVVISDMVLTSRGPATAMKFALAIVSVLKGEELSQKVASELLVE